MNRGAFQIIVLTLVFAVVYSVGLQLTGIRAWFCETNYHANLLEVEDYLYGPPPKVVLIGSSLTMTLLPRYFAEVDADVRNLAMAGGKPITGLRLLENRPDRPTVVLIEFNTLLDEPGPNDREILAATEGFTFWLARWLPPLRTSARPTSILYTFIKLRKDAILKPSVLPPASDASGENTVSATNITEGTLNPTAIEVLDRIRQLKAAGITVGVYRLPVGVADKNIASTLHVSVQELELPFLDLKTEMTRRMVPINYTDNLHLRVESARAAAHMLAEWIKNGMVD